MKLLNLSALEIYLDNSHIGFNDLVPRTYKKFTSFIIYLYKNVTVYGWLLFVKWLKIAENMVNFKLCFCKCCQQRCILYYLSSNIE